MFCHHILLQRWWKNNCVNNMIEDKYNTYKLKELFHNLIDATKSGYCKWEVSKGYIDNNEVLLSYMSDDGETTYKTSIKIKDNSYDESCFKYIWVINNSLKGPDNVHGREIFAAYDLTMEKEFNILYKVLYNDFVKPRDKKTNSILDKMISNVCKQFVREKKLTNILNGEKKESDIKDIIKRKKIWGLF